MTTPTLGSMGRTFSRDVVLYIAFVYGIAKLCDQYITYTNRMDKVKPMTAFLLLFSLATFMAYRSQRRHGIFHPNFSADVVDAINDINIRNRVENESISDRQNHSFD